HLLGAVAVVIVDVEDGDLLAAIVAKPLGCDRDVVEEAIAAEEIGAGMVARWAAEREHGALAGLHEPGAGERDVSRCGDGAPGARHDRRPGVDGVVADLAVDLLGYRRVLAEAAGMPVQRQ